MTALPAGFYVCLRLEAYMQPAISQWIHRFRALGDETRVDLLAALQCEELSVSELAEVIQAAQPGVSRHLAALRDAGLVLSRKQGQATFYRIRPGEPLLEGPLGSELRKRAKELGLPARVEQVLLRRRMRAEAFFDRQAETWDELRAQLFAESAALWSLSPLLPRGLHVADIGTGTGGMLPYLAEIADRIVAIDLSTQMLRRARARAKSLGIEGVEFVKADLSALPLDDESVDVAFAALVLHHAERPAQALSEMARIVRQNGTVVVTDLCAHGHEWLREEHGDLWLGFSRDEVVGHMNDAGLVDVRYRVVSRAEVTGRGPAGPLELFVASGRVPNEGKEKGRHRRRA